MKNILLILSIYILTFLNIGLAKDITNIKWFSLGGGQTIKAFEDNRSGISLSILGNREYNNKLISLHMVYNLDFETSKLGYMPSPIESISHLGATYSLYKMWNGKLVSAGLGPSIIHFIERGKLISDNWPSASEYEKITTKRLGLLFNFQLVLLGSDYFGMSFQPYTNLNTKHTYSGFSICINIGKF